MNSNGLSDAIHKSASTPWPAYALSTLFLSTSLLRPEKYPGLPPFIQRFGFGLIFSGAGSIIHSGDTENGSGVATAWTLSYLVFDKWRQPKHPRTPLTLLLTGAVASTAALYGTEYFLIGPERSRRSYDNDVS